MIDYHLHELGSVGFEKLVTHVCFRILGQGISSFAPGPDGGKDCHFEGKANDYPSSNSCWDGNFIIQAKFTQNPYANCSDRDFFENQSSVVKKEIPKIISLQQNGELDYYLLFTNRRLTGGYDSKISKYIKDNTGVKAAKILGLEEFDKYFTEYPDLVKTMGLDKLNGPLRFCQEDLRQIIIIFNENKGVLSHESNDSKLIVFNLEEKNDINRLGGDYFNDMKKDSELHFYEIESFLKNPINKEYTELYYSIAKELKHKISIHREEFNNFEGVFDHIYDQMSYLLPSGNMKGLVWVFLHFMYFHCDIGKAPC